MIFTSKEKAAIVHVATTMQLIDNDMDDKETLLNTMVFIKIGVDGSDINLSKKTSTLEAIITIANMTKDEKTFVCSFLAALIAIDGKIEKEEVKFWQLISKLCNFPTMSLQDAIKKFSEYV